MLWISDEFLYFVFEFSNRIFKEVHVRNSFIHYSLLNLIYFMLNNERTDLEMKDSYKSNHTIDYLKNFNNSTIDFLDSFKEQSPIVNRILYL